MKPDWRYNNDRHACKPAPLSSAPRFALPPAYVVGASAPYNLGVPHAGEAGEEANESLRKFEDNDLVGITGAFCAKAETGTLMMPSDAETPATTSLLPETHVAVLDPRRIVNSMEDAWDLLRREHKQLPRAVNFISGPSRTADIEQTVTLGAHGPYRVLLILAPIDA